MKTYCKNLAIWKLFFKIWKIWAISFHGKSFVQVKIIFFWLKFGKFWWGQALQPNGTHVPAWTLALLANIQKRKRITDQSCNMKPANLLSLLHLVPSMLISYYWHQVSITLQCVQNIVTHQQAAALGCDFSSLSHITVNASPLLADLWQI
jgi:hypothetical protein